MGRRLIFILGGARSGKSALARRLAEARADGVLFVATAEARDAEMAARIARHRAERPAGWRTLEAPRRVGAAIREEERGAGLILLDCLALLLGNVLAVLPEGAAEADGWAAWEEEARLLRDAYARSGAEWIVVSNEVGMGLVPPYPAGRLFRDVLGRANQGLAAEADEVYLPVAGLPLRLK